MRIAITDLAEVISDLEYWCTADGEELIVEELQTRKMHWERETMPPTEEIESKRAEIQERVKRLQKLQEESLSNPAFVWRFELEEFKIDGDLPFSSNRHERFLLFNDFLYSFQGPYTDEELKLLCLQEFDKERSFFESLKSKFSESEDDSVLEKAEEQKLTRSISEKVRIYVWRRDGGRCTKCGSREKLEYDHIIPVSLGGGNTARNIELLCEGCNRSKGAEIR